MIFPIGDQQVKGGHTPYFSYGLIIANIAIFIWQMMAGPSAISCELGAIPIHIVQGEKLHTFISSMFLHGGIGHLLGNLIFLWIFADNIEATVGSPKFLFLYFSGGIIAVLAHIYLGTSFGLENCCDPCGIQGNMPCTTGMGACGLLTPMIGASGAISTVLGAYLVMFPHSKIRVLFFVIPFRVPAFLFLGFWAYQQWTSGLAANAGYDSSVAYWAHIGGFVFGLVLGLIFRTKRREPQRAFDAKDFI